jgi:hypothetical protein
MNLPANYAELILKLPALEVNFGCGGIKILEISELEKGQAGYAVSPDGRSLCGDKDGDWRSNWIAIGYETCLGDPIFVDSANPKLPVFTAIHGEGAWEPDLIALSFDAFAKILHELAQIAIGRTNPVEQEDNPLTDGDRKAFLARVNKINEGQIETEFWEAMLED